MYLATQLEKLGFWLLNDKEATRIDKENSSRLQDSAASEFYPHLMEGRARMELNLFGKDHLYRFSLLKNEAVSA